MQTIRVAALTGLVVALATATSQAQVEVSEVHICCGNCVKIIGATLADVDGVANASCSKETKTVTFDAENEKAVKAGLKALSEAGFYGKAKMVNRDLEFPKEKVKKGDKADEVVFYGVHLCCPGCAKAVGAALKDLGEAECDNEEKVVILRGDSISVAKALAALNKAGFNGSLKKPEKKEDQ